MMFGCWEVSPQGFLTPQTWPYLTESFTPADTSDPSTWLADPDFPGNNWVQHVDVCDADGNLIGVIDREGNVKPITSK